MKYIRVNDTFVGISNTILTVNTINEETSELVCGSTDPHNSERAFHVVGSKVDIVNKIERFLEKSQRLLVLQEADD